ncbi:MAG: extracellular solute-binding protein [Roseiflexaceae bacterium]
MRTVWGVRFCLVFVIIVCTACATPAVERGPLVIYSGRTEAFIQPILDAFATAHPEIAVVVKYGKNSELAALLLEERDRPQADIFLTTDMLVPLSLINEGVLAPAPIPGSEYVPATLKDAQGRWTSVTSRARVIIYNTDLVSPADAPQSMLALTDPRWRGKVAFADASNGPFQSQIAGMMHLLGTPATDAWVRALVANNTAFLANATDLRMAVGSGEFAIGVANHYHYELQRREATNNHVGVVFPDQGPTQMGVLMNTSTVSQVAGSAHPDAAATFAAFLYAPATQQLFADVNYEFPVVPGVRITSGATQPDDFRQAAVSMDVVAADAQNAVLLMQNAGIP